MEPVSLAIGAIPLAVYIIDGAARIRKAIERYNSAANNIQSLAEKLELLESQCSAIRHALAKSSLNAQNNDTISPSSDNISRWLFRVATRLGSIEAILSHLVVQTSKSRFSCQKTALRFVRNREKIEEFVQLLDDDMKGLNGMVLVQFWSDSVSRVTPDHKVSAGSSLQAEWNALRPPTRTHRSFESMRIVRHSESRFQLIFGLVSVKNVRKVTKLSQFQREVTASEQTRISLRLLRSDLLLELVYQSCLGCWNSFSVGIVQALPLWHELRHVVEDAIHREGDDPTYLQELLSERKLSLSMTFNGASIFLLAAGACRINICRYLATFDLRLFEDLGSYHIMFRVATDESIIIALELIDMFLGIAAAIPSVRDFAGFVELWNHPQYFILCYDKFRPLLLNDMPSFISMAWNLAVELYLVYFWLGMPYVEDEWHPLFQRLIDDGVDVHRLFLRKNATEGSLEMTALRHITTFLEDSIRTDEMVWHWAMLLQRCGVDTHGLFEREALFWQVQDLTAGESGDIDRQSHGRIFLKRTGGYSLPAWERWVSHDSPAYELLHEFRSWDWEALEKDHGKNLIESHENVDCGFCSAVQKNNERRRLGKKRRGGRDKARLRKLDAMPGSWVDL